MELEVTFQYLKEGFKEEGDRLFSKVCFDRTRRNVSNKKRGVVVETSFLDTLQVRLDGTLST